MVFKKSKSKSFRAQAAVEMLVLLAVALMILTIFVGIMWDTLFVQRNIQNQKVALFTVNSVAKSINDAYFLGPGTVRTITAVLPDDINFSASAVSGRTILLNVNGSDIVAFTKPEVRGTWPGVSGTYVFTIVSYGDFVTLNVEEVSFSPRSVSRSVERDTTESIIVAATNLGTTKDYVIGVEFDYSDGTLLTSSLDADTVTLTSDVPFDIDLNIYCSSASAGTYLGRLNLVSDTNLSIPIKVVCLSGQTKLSILPSSKTINVTNNSINYYSFLVCNSSQSDFTSSSSTVSGAISTFAFTSFSGAITKDTCRDLNLMVAPTDTGTFVGSVSVDSSNLSSSSDVTIVVT